MQHPLRRFSVSMAGSLVGQLDTLVEATGYRNRSRALSDMVRAQLVEHRAYHGNQEIVGTITIVYDHHKRGVQALLTEIQHRQQHLIVSTMHIHLDHHNCLEVLAVRGRARDVKKIADRLIATRGVKHGRLTVTTTGEQFTV
jgi:CopG family nickel-responsive transcriptional regulator